MEKNSAESTEGVRDATLGKRYLREDLKEVR